MASEITKSPCHNSGITGDGKCDVCMNPIAGAVPTVAPEPKIGNEGDPMGKTTGAAETIPAPTETANTGTGDDTNTQQ